MDYFDVSSLIEQDIVRPDVPQVPLQPQEVVRRFAQPVQDVPQLVLLKHTLDLAPVHDLVHQHVREQRENDLDGAGVTAHLSGLH